MKLRGWPLVGWAALGIGAMCVLALAIHGTGDAGVGAVLRWTARTSAVLFCLAIGASSLRRLWPNAATKWILANRRYLGVSFGVSHTYHLAAVIVYLQNPEIPAGPALLVPTSLAYAFVAAMVATSFDRTASWLGARRWKLLHTVGGWYIWTIMTYTAVEASLRRPGSIPVAALLIGTLVLKVAARR